MPEEAKANARLIAAAPELLEACVDINRACASVHEWDGNDGGVIIDVGLSRRTINYLREAIAKAGGE